MYIAQLSSLRWTSLLFDLTMSLFAVIFGYLCATDLSDNDEDLTKFPEYLPSC